MLLLDPHGRRGRFLKVVSKSCSHECKLYNASLTRKLVFPKLSVVSEMSRFYMDALRCHVNRNMTVNRICFMSGISVGPDSDISSFTDELCVGELVL